MSLSRVAFAAGVGAAAIIAARRESAQHQAGQTAPVRPRVLSTPSPREVKQQVLNGLLQGGNANKVRDLATSRPDLMEAASPEQRAKMSKILLDRFFFGTPDKQALIAILKPAQSLGELPESIAILKGAGGLGTLFSKMGDEGEGLDLAKVGLAAGLYDQLSVVEELGVNGVKALVRVVTNEQLDAMNRDSKWSMIGTLQNAPQSDDIEVMIRRLRNHLG
jgi:hypothetical protein